MPRDTGCVIDEARKLAVKMANAGDDVEEITRKIVGKIEEVGDILDNIRYANPNLNDAEVKKMAAEFVSAHTNNSKRMTQLRQMKQDNIISLGETYGRYMEPEIDKRLTEIDSIISEAVAKGDQETYLSATNERSRELFKLQKHYPDALLALLQGETNAVKGSGISVNSVGKAIAGKYVSGFEAELRKNGWYEVAFSGKIEKEIARELEDINGPKLGNVTGSVEAEGIAKIISQYQKNIMDRKNKAGAYIKPLFKYISKTSHDLFRVRKAGPEAWVEFILGNKLLDMERTFGAFRRNRWSELKAKNLPDVAISQMVENETKEALTKMYAEIISGEFMIVGDSVKPLAMKMSEHRELHFKNSDAWLTYNNEYGSKDLISAILGDFEKSGNDIGAMELLGPDISGLKRNVLSSLTEMAKVNPELAKSWTGMKKNRVKALFSYIDGTSTIPVDNTLANISSGIKAWTNLTKMGSALLSQTGDPVFTSAALQHVSGNYLSGYGVALESFFKGFVMPQGSAGAQLRREIADDAGVLIEGILHDSAERFTEVNNLPGTASKIQATFFKATGMNRWDNGMRAGVAYWLTNKFTKMSNLTFDELRPGLQREFRKHGLNSGEWDVIRASKMEAADGRFYISPREIGEVADEVISNIFGDIDIAAKRQEIETNYRAYLYNTINDAVPTPGIREQTRIKGTTSKGTWGGEATSLFAQFKTFPLVAIRLLRKELHGKGERTVGTSASRMARLSSNYKRSSMYGMFNLIAGATMMGYLAMTLKDISKGRTPKDISKNPGKVLGAAFIQGGAAGIFGDFLFGLENRYGQGPLESLLGPTWGTASQLTKLGLTATGVIGGDKDPDLLYRQTVGLVKQNIPGIIPLGPARYIPINLWYTRGALDYLYINYLQNEINPGYFNRMNRRMKKETGNHSFLQPGLGLD